MSTQLPDNQLSIRASCDRCRVQKLKCIVSPPKSKTSEVRCQRCIRAATECVFSRRSNSKRERVASEDLRPPSRKRSALPTPSQDGTAPIQPTALFDVDETPREWCEPNIQDMATVINPDLQFGGPTAHFMTPEPTPDFDMGLIDPNLHYQLPLQSLNNELLNLSHDLGLLTPEPEPMRSACYNFSPDLSPPSLAGSSVSSNSSVSALSDGQQTNPRRIAAKSLLTLSMTLEESLDQLANQTWQGGSRGSFDHYPVGSVLHLFQEFIDTVAGLRGLRLCDSFRDDQKDFNSGDLPFYPPKADEPTAWQNATPSSNSTSQLDASLMLIVLSCYATLTRICTIVLGHFKQHLKANTAHCTSAPPATTANKCDFTATTCLGELARPTESYTQIHTAASLLLELLEKATYALTPVRPTSQTSNHIAPGNFDVSSAIGAHMQPTDYPTASCLVESAAGLRSAFVELEEKSSELKELLRRKMRL
ncbi:hypothetical protein F4861DRAFT_536931 [Xylaria intraflava]|nr:hypothetical protein F4861DRAFT_536931 [Xylaria intraflava]